MALGQAAARVRRSKVTLEAYLRKNLKRMVIDHSIRAEVRDGKVQFYLHATGNDSDTLDFRVEGDTLIPLVNGSPGGVRNARY